MFHFWQDFLKKAVFVGFGGHFVEVKLKFLVTYLVALLILPILFCVLLNRLVCQVNLETAISLQRVEIRRGADVSLGVPVGLLDTIDGSEEKIMSDVKLSTFIQ